MAKIDFSAPSIDERRAKHAAAAQMVAQAALNTTSPVYDSWLSDAKADDADDGECNIDNS